MKNLLLIIDLLVISLFIPFCPYSKPVDISKCNFISDNENEIYEILDNGTIYKDINTKGMLWL